MLEMRVGQFAELLGVHRNTVHNWIRNKALAAQPLPGKKYAVTPETLVSFLRSKGLAEDTIQETINHMKKIGTLKKVSLQKPSILKKEVPMSNKPVGSVLLVGGGIAGIQASLDLADSGYYVYLVEKSPGIGGGMAKLDKTFPTNDCAM